MNPSRRRSPARLIAAAAAAAAAVVPSLPPATATAGAAPAVPGQDGPATQRDDVGRLPTGGDATQRTTGLDVVTSLDDVAADVAARVADVEAARAAEAAAEAELAAADAAVAETQQRIDDLTTRSDEAVVEAFVNPPVESALDALSAASPTDATVRQSILTGQTDANADLLTELDAARTDLAVVKAVQEEAAAAAEERAAEAAEAHDALVASQSQETLFVLAVQDRTAANLAEADALAAVDPAAAGALRARETEIAAKIADLVAAREQRAAEEALQQAMAEAAARAAAEAAARPRGGGEVGPATGTLATVACPGGGSITVDGSLAANLQALLAAAAADGNHLCGGGYRDPAQQIALREAHCGTSYYAIYEAPSSACSPPTARPGTSNHEQGLAVDFTCNGGGSLSSSSPCFAWLERHAADYGLHNLPSEPWHWSTDGT